MLGESHSLANEFPNFIDDINLLSEQDPEFAKRANEYNDLDTKIRNIELENSPISDAEIHQLKHDRAVLKDVLYKRLQESRASGSS